MANQMNSLMMWNAAASVLARPERAGDGGRRIHAAKERDRRKGERYMPQNVNWEAVWQSVTDTWIPLLGIILLFLLGWIWYKKRKVR